MRGLIARGSYDANPFGLYSSMTSSLHLSHDLTHAHTQHTHTLPSSMFLRCVQEHAPAVPDEENGSGAGCGGSERGGSDRGADDSGRDGARPDCKWMLDPKVSSASPE